MSFPDLTTLSDEGLRDGYREYAEEISRRHELVSIPAQVKDLADQYEAGGGSRQSLVEALTAEE